MTLIIPYHRNSQTQSYKHFSMGSPGIVSCFALLMMIFYICFFFTKSTSVQFSHSVMSDSLRPHGLQHTRLPCTSPTPGADWVFSNESVLRIRWPKYWSFSFTISPSKEYSGQISFRIDWFYLLAGLYSQNYGFSK